MTPREACEQIGALTAEGEHGGWWVDARAIEAILAQVEPRPAV